MPPIRFAVVAACLFVVGCGDAPVKLADGDTPPGATPDTRAVAHEVAKPHVVFVTGDEEYRSEESMPMLAAILERDFGCRTTLCYAVDEQGAIAPNRADHIDGLEALATADLCVMFLRFRALPDAELQHVLDYVDSGRPLVGFRTTTHAFRYPKDHPQAEAMNEAWPLRVFGQKWITHHGHFDDGNAPLTRVTKRPGVAHPILRGVTSFDAFSWLYHVDGGGDALMGNVEPLLDGESLRSNHAARAERYPRSNPVAWIKTNISSAGKKTRVFFTTLGHPYDFTLPTMRRFAVQGILWALKRDKEIPDGGVRIEIPTPFTPSNSGFGQVYRQHIYPNAPVHGAGEDTESKLHLQDGDRIVLLGNSLADRMRFDGTFESGLHQAAPNTDFSIRNIGWNGEAMTPPDTIPYRDLGGGPLFRYWSGDALNTTKRTVGFPTQEDFLLQLQPESILLFFGLAASFEPPERLPRFRAALESMLRELAAKSFNGGASRPQLVLISPLAHESVGGRFPDGAAHNERLRAVTKTMREIAKVQRVLFVDLFTPSSEPREERWTENGLHLNATGHQAVTNLLLDGLGLTERDTTPNADLRAAVLEKSRMFLQRYRPLNTEYIYGSRVEPFGSQDFPARFKALDNKLSAADRDILETLR